MNNSVVYARTSAVKPSIWYDRTIPDEFLAELRPDGRFGRLVRFARGWHLADVQLRATGGLSWATIYCGLTNVLRGAPRDAPLSAPRRSPADDRQPEWAARAGAREAVGEQSAEILNRMLGQRIKIGLERDSSVSLSYPLDIVPVIAIQDPVRSQALDRLDKVQDRLLAAGQGWPNLEVWRVRPSVAINRHRSADQTDHH